LTEVSVFHRSVTVWVLFSLFVDHSVPVWGALYQGNVLFHLYYSLHYKRIKEHHFKDFLYIT